MEVWQMFQVGDLVRFRNSAIRRDPPGRLVDRRVKGCRVRYARRRQCIARIIGIVNANYDQRQRRWRVFVLLDSVFKGHSVDAQYLVLHRRDPNWMLRQLHQPLTLG